MLMPEIAGRSWYWWLSAILSAPHLGNPHVNVAYLSAFLQLSFTVMTWYSESSSADLLWIHGFTDSL